MEERKTLDRKLAALREAQKIAHRMHRHKPKGKPAILQALPDIDKDQTSLSAVASLRPRTSLSLMQTRTTRTSSMESPPTAEAIDYMNLESRADQSKSS